MRLDLLSAVLAASLCSDLFAQTTWTSLEDRRGHSIAASPNGSVLMFGGESVESPGTLLGDTKSLVASTTNWLAAGGGTPPPKTAEHAMAGALASPTLPIFVMFGGEVDSVIPGVKIPTNETFTYEGGWGKVTQLPTWPSPRTGHAMVANLQTNTFLMFGGRSGGVPQNDLWEFDPGSGTWTPLTPTGTPPSPRFNHCMAYDPIGLKVYVFGGSGFLGDTWEYDTVANSWMQMNPTNSPSGRQQSAMTYLPFINGFLLFGGLESQFPGTNTLADTWFFDPVAGDWTEAFPATVPPARYEHSLSSTPTDRVVMLGGTNGTQTILGSTWEWDPVVGNWIERNPPPSARSGVAMAFDVSRSRHVAFGGRAVSGGSDLDETWELNGLSWEQRATAPTPSTRADAGLAYDELRGVAVMYGGRQNGACGTELSDTWEWNGNTWTPVGSLPGDPPVAGGTQPVFDRNRGVVWMLVGADMWEYSGSWRRASQPARSSFGSAYDSVRGRLVMACGDTTTGLIDETWEWDGLSWSLLTPSGGSPQPRKGVGMSFHAQSGQCVLFAGQGAGTNYGDTWTWDGLSWMQLAGSQSLTSYSTLSYHPVFQKSIRFGGTITTTTFSNVTKSWDPGATWQTLAGGGAPQGRWHAAMVYDPVRDEIVMFGGSQQVGLPSTLNDTWTFDGSTWTQKSPATSPSARQTVLAWDEVTQSVILFGGFSYGPSVYYDDTWRWDGSNWIPEPALSRPSPRRLHAIESFGGRTILWGGENTGVDFADMWEWNGSEWVELSGGPPRRTNYGAAYDVARDRVVVFGGREVCGGGTFLQDTWEWDGAAWHRTTPTSSPSPRERAQLSYDEARGCVVLFGGNDGVNPVLGDTWEWDGLDWTQRQVANAAPASTGHAMSFDPLRRVTVALGAAGTWDYGPVDPPTVVSTQTNMQCVDSLGQSPMIEPTISAGPWLGEPIELTVTTPPPIAVGLMMLGFQDQTYNGIPLPLSLAVLGSMNCELNIDAQIIELIPSVNAYSSAPMPTDPMLVGARIFMQAGFLEFAQGAFLPLITSNYLETTLGSK